MMDALDKSLDLEEETYSVIFKALKHPMRRKIMRILAARPMNFTQLMEEVKIESGHLAYHLECLNGLVFKDKQAKYCLSSPGQAALNLMIGVEEPSASLRPQRPFRAETIKSILSVMLAIGLLLSGVLLVSYTTYAESVPGQEKIAIPITLGSDPKEPMTLAPGKSFMLVFSRVYATGISGATIYDNGTAYIVQMNAPAPTESYAAWVKEWFRVETRFLDYGMIEINVTNPNGNQVLHQRITQSSGMGCPWVCWKIDLTKPGSYALTIKNLFAESTHLMGTVSFGYSRWERPFFWWGFLNAVLGIVYLTIFLASLLRRKKSW